MHNRNSSPSRQSAAMAFYRAFEQASRAFFNFESIGADPQFLNGYKLALQDVSAAAPQPLFSQDGSSEGGDLLERRRFTAVKASPVQLEVYGNGSKIGSRATCKPARYSRFANFNS